MALQDNVSLNELTIYFWIRSHKSQKQCRRGSVHSSECWLFIVVLQCFIVSFAETSD